MAAAPQIPPGVNLNDNRGPAIIRISVAVTTVTVFFVAARLISRRMKKATLKMSDYLALLSLLGCMLFTALDIYGESIFGKRHWQVHGQKFDEL